MMKRIVCLLAVASLFSGYIAVSASLSAVPHHISFFGTGEAPSKTSGIRTGLKPGKKMIFTQLDRDKLQKMFQRFKNRKLINKTAP